MRQHLGQDTSGQNTKCNRQQFQNENSFDTAEQLRNEGKRQIKDWNYLLALELLSQSLEINKQDEVCWSLKGSALYQLKREEEAIYCFDKALQINPNGDKYYYQKGESLYNLQQYEQAQICFDKAIQINPNRHQKKLVAKEQVCQTNSYYFKTVSNQQQQNLDSSTFATTLFRQGEQLFQQNDFNEAIRFYNKAISFNPDCDKYYYKKGESLQALQRFQEANECFDKALQIKPDSDVYHNSKGNALMSLTLYYEALDSFEIANCINRSHIYITNYAIALKKIGYNLVALRKFQDALKINANYQLAIDEINNLKKLNLE